LFAGQIEAVFYGELGLADPELVAYLTALLERYVHMDAIFQAGQLDDRRIDGIIKLMRRIKASPRAVNRRRVRAVHRYIGDFTLFWAGLFPEAVRRQGHISGGSGDTLHDYMGCGRRPHSSADRAATSPRGSCSSG
jgi:hypothetical protein